MAYMLGEIEKTREVDRIFPFLEIALSDKHHSVRNAVIGSLKQTGQKNPKATLEFAQKYLHHSDPKIRRETLHGIELRGRTHPEDILPLLKKCRMMKTKKSEICLFMFWVKLVIKKDAL